MDKMTLQKNIDEYREELDKGILNRNKCLDHTKISEWIHQSKNTLQEINYKLDTLNEVTVKNGNNLMATYQRNEFLQNAYDTMREFESFKSIISNTLVSLDESQKLIMEIHRERITEKQNKIFIKKHWKIALGIIGAISTILVIITQIILIKSSL